MANYKWPNFTQVSITTYNCIYKRKIKELEAYLMLNYTYQLSWWWKCKFRTRIVGHFFFWWVWIINCHISSWCFESTSILGINGLVMMTWCHMHIMRCYLSWFGESNWDLTCPVNKSKIGRKKRSTLSTIAAHAVMTRQ